jgi:hypothetical protein
VPQTAARALEPAPAPKPPTSAPIAGATAPAASASSAAPVATFEAPRGVDSLSKIDLPGSERGLAVSTESVLNAPGVRGSPAEAPAVAARSLAALAALTAAAHASWAETLARLASGGLSGGRSDGLGTALAGGAPSGGMTPLPAGPAAPSSAGSSSGSGVSGAGGALGLGVLALLFALSPLGGKFLRYWRDFPRPNSALVLVTERPG